MVQCRDNTLVNLHHRLRLHHCQLKVTSRNDNFRHVVSYTSYPRASVHVQNIQSGKIEYSSIWTSVHILEYMRKEKSTET